jgi:hypothetical protein
VRRCDHLSGAAAGQSSRTSDRIETKLQGEVKPVDHFSRDGLSIIESSSSRPTHPDNRRSGTGWAEGRRYRTATAKGAGPSLVGDDFGDVYHRCSP